MKAPRPVLVVAVLLVLAGAVSIAAHPPTHWQWQVALFVLVNAIGIASGVLLLRRHSWVRWLAAVWLAGHVVIGALNSVGSAVVHGVLAAILIYALFCREATEWFRGRAGATSSA